MRKIILFCTFMVHIFVMNAQLDERCGTPDNTALDPVDIYSGSTDPAVLANYPPVVYNVFFWRINKDNGSNDRPVTETNILRRVAKLNILFNKFNVFFKYKGYDDTNFNSTAHYDGSFLTFIRNYAQQEGLIEPNSFNIYIAHGFAIGAGQSSYNTTSCAGNSYHFLREDNGVVLHEVAHNFDIRHTRSSNEHTTREEFLPNGAINPNFNAKTKGDRVVDTAANSGFYDSSCECRPFINPNDCTYFGEEMDNIGIEYDIFHEDVINLMSDSGTQCVDSEALTIGQGIRIREAIAADVAGVFGDAETTVAYLFEPYVGNYYNSGPLLPAHKPLFQPGFDYNFTQCQCDCPQPSDDNTSFTLLHNQLLTISKYETDYSSITHPNHSAIHIPILPNGSQDIGGPNIRRCYDNWNRAASDGKVTKFLDGVLNTNVTVTPQDSTAINNNQLIDNLAPGLYNVEKNYDDGSSQEQVILKSGN